MRNAVFILLTSLAFTGSALAAPSYLICKNANLTVNFETTPGHEAISMGKYGRSTSYKILQLNRYRHAYGYRVQFQSGNGREVYTLATRGISGFAGWVINAQLTKAGTAAPTRLTCESIVARH